MRLTGTIYRNAEGVLVSLGPHADGSESLLERMESMLCYVSDAAELDKPAEQTSGDCSTLSRHDEFPATSSAPRQAGERAVATG